MEYTRDLGSVGHKDAGEVGGKTANLGELRAAGLPVPDGFVITVAAYRDFLTANEISGDDGDDAERLGEAIRTGDVPAGIREEIAAAYGRLDAGKVAVRSSGTAEDLAGASYAGQYDTYLNVTGDGEVIDAVRACWASLWNARAVEYRRGLSDTGDVALMPVLVQSMVDAEWAGVMFTADPVSGRRDRVVVEAVRRSGVAAPGTPDDGVAGRAGAGGGDTHRPPQAEPAPGTARALPSRALPRAALPDGPLGFPGADRTNMRERPPPRRDRRG